MSYLMTKIDKTNVLLSVLFNIFFNRCFNQNVYLIFHYFLETQMVAWSQTSTGLSVCVYGGLHEMLTMPATVLLEYKTIL